MARSSPVETLFPVGVLFVFLFPSTRTHPGNSQGVAKGEVGCLARWFVTWNDAWVAIGRMQIENQYPTPTVTEYQETRRFYRGSTTGRTFNIREELNVHSFESF